jgi:DNA segregation ATPase FtsK/SpoIIIE, S-DNA-T family
VKGKLAIALGKSIDGAPVVADLTAMPHLLIAGTTGSGKSVAVNAIIACLLLRNSPDDLKFIMVDPKRVELTGYNGIPHLASPVVVDLERIVGVLKYVAREMDERYKKFAAAGARHLIDYNSKVGPSDPKLPYLVVVIDELADLMMLAPDETERVLTRLAQMARATGIHLIISTQRPSVDVVTGLIKANFPARVSFAVASSVDSRVILDSPGAEKLLGRGDMLYQAPDAAAPLRVQGVYVSDGEINRITRFWKDSKPGTESRTTALASGVTFDEGDRKPRGTGSDSAPRTFATSTSTASTPTPVRRPNPDSDEDPMYTQAAEIVRQKRVASVQLLARMLRIGPNHAERLIEQLKKNGVVGNGPGMIRLASADSGNEDDM